jgi:hypothetical protein
VTIRADLPPVEAAPPPSRPPRTPWSRRRKLVVLVVLLVVALVAAWLIERRVSAHRYDPLEPGSYGRSVATHAITATDGVEETRFVMTGPPGTVTQAMYSIRNGGSRPVELLGIRRSGFVEKVTMQWGPGIDSEGRGWQPSEARPFPVTLPPGQELTLWVSVTKPKCEPGEGREMDTLPVRWSAMGVTHVFDFPLAAGGGRLPIAICVAEPGTVHGRQYDEWLS